MKKSIIVCLAVFLIFSGTLVSLASPRAVPVGDGASNTNYPEQIEECVID